MREDRSLHAALGRILAGLDVLRAIARGDGPRRRRWRPGAAPRRFWSAAETGVVRARYAEEPTAGIARTLGRSTAAVWSRARILGLHKSARYLATAASGRILREEHRGRACWFPKGHIPANKGLRRPGWHVGRMAATQFKKGQMPKTWVPVGTEVIDEDGYRKRKIADDRARASRFNWVFVHRLLWERARGPVPPGHAVVFKNGDRADLRLANLELVSRRELMRRNSVHRLPKPLAEIIQLRGALMRQIRRRSA